MKLVDDAAFQVDPSGEDGNGSVDSFVDRFMLQPTTFDNKQSYLRQLKHHMQLVKMFQLVSGASQGDITAMENAVSTYTRQIAWNFKNYEFFTSASGNPDGMVILKTYHDDGRTPYFTYWKHGLKAEQV
nr:hypothetical protein [Streptomyces sp. SID9727]